MDSKIKSFSDDVKEFGKDIKNENFIGSELMGDFVIGTGDLIVDGTDYIGDSLGSIASIVNAGLQPIKDDVAKGIKKIWDQINPWN